MNNTNALSAVSLPTETLEPGSFRDRSAQVFYCGSAVYRSLDTSAAGDWEALKNTIFFSRLSQEGKLVKSCAASASHASTTSSHLPCLVLEHERIPFVSYPYEWSFGMLKASALLQLEVLAAALNEGFILKDGSSFNVSFVGSQPVFHDIGSFTRWNPGDIWAGYRQFCETLLFPLLIAAYRGISHQTWTRGSLEGIAVKDAYHFFSFRDWFRPGIVKHVVLQYLLERQFASSQRSVRSEVKSLSFGAEIVKANVRSLRKLIEKLDLRSFTSTWANYAQENSYAESDHKQKCAFIENVCAERPRNLVWDLGANTGTFSRLAAPHASQVLALDFDEMAVERLYRALSQEGNRTILPLVMNIANISSGQGWNSTERRGLAERGKPDLVLALALIHHVVISAHIPLPQFVEWLASLSSELVIEFVGRSDPMVQTLLRNKADIYHDYQQDLFEQCLRKYYNIVRQESLLGGNRTIYYCASDKSKTKVA